MYVTPNRKSPKVVSFVKKVRNLPRISCHLNLSRQKIGDTFPSKQDLTFHANCPIFPRKQDMPFQANCLIFPIKQDLTFHANCLQKICMKCQILFYGKNKKNLFKCCLLKILELNFILSASLVIWQLLSFSSFVVVYQHLPLN